MRHAKFGEVKLQAEHRWRRWYAYVPPEGLAWVSGASSLWRRCPGTCTGKFPDLSWGSPRLRNRRTRMKPAISGTCERGCSFPANQVGFEHGKRAIKTVTLTLPDVLIGLETWRLRMLSSERGDSVPDLLRNSLDILSLPILKQSGWN